MDRRLPSALAVTILLVAAFYSSFYVLPRGSHPCHEDLAAAPPLVDFDFEAGETLTVAHRGGDTLHATNSRSLTIRFTDSETGTVSSVVLLNGTVGDPLEPGDEVTVSQDSVRGDFSAGDEVVVVWRGTTHDVSAACSTYHDVESAVLERHTLTETTESTEQ